MYFSPNNSRDPNEIVLTESGDVLNPIDIDTFLTVIYITCCLIGIPLNVSIAVTIIRYRRFHRSPRNIFLLGIIFSYLSFFIPAINEPGSSISSSSLKNYNSMFARTKTSIHVNRKIIGQMEMEATRTLVIGVTSLVVTACSPTIFVSSFLACRLMSQSDCSHFNWLAPYMVELGLVNIVCSPLIFLTRNKELRAA